MPDYTLKGPNGQSYTLRTPEGTTREQAMAVATKHLRDLIAPSSPKTEVAGGAFNMPQHGRAADTTASFGFEAQQLPQQDEGEIHGKIRALEAQGRSKGDPEWEKLVRQRATEERRRQTDVTPYATVVGAAPEGLAMAIGNTLRRTFVKAAPKQAAVAAREAGYVLPPTQIAPENTIATKAASGWSGKIKTAQAASAKNQEVTNRLAAKALGLPEGSALSEGMFKSVRADASKAYDAVVKAVPVVKADAEFLSEVKALGGSSSQAAQYFPQIMNNRGIQKLIQGLSSRAEAPTQAAVDVVKQLRFQGNANLKAIGDPAKHALGLAQREAADAIDGLIERNIIRQKQIGIGGTDVVKKYRKARQLIARSYDVEGVTASNGDVSAMGLARLANRGRPLTGELDQIATAADAFPRAFQMPEKFGGTEDWSVLDFFGASGSALAGRPDIAAMFVARPAVRAGMLSGPMQNLLASGPATGAGLGSLTPAAAAALIQGHRQ